MLPQCRHKYILHLAHSPLAVRTPQHFGHVVADGSPCTILGFAFGVSAASRSSSVTCSSIVPLCDQRQADRFGRSCRSLGCLPCIFPPEPPREVALSSSISVKISRFQGPAPMPSPEVGGQQKRKLSRADPSAPPLAKAESPPSGTQPDEDGVESNFIFNKAFPWPSSLNSP